MSLFKPEEFKKHIEFHRIISHNIQYLFDEAMQGKFEDMESNFEDLWKWLMIIRPLPNHFSFIPDCKDAEYIKEKISTFENKYKLMLENTNLFEFVLSCEANIENNKVLAPEERKDYEEAKRECEEIRKKVGYIDYDDCCKFKFYAKQILCYFENFAFPVRVIEEYFIKYIYDGMKEASTEIKPTLEQQSRDIKIEKVCDMTGNKGWQMLLDAGIIKWKDTNDPEPFCMIKEKTSIVLLLFCVCLVNDMLEQFTDEEGRNCWQPSKRYSTRVINPQIELLFGKKMKQKIAAAKRDNGNSKYKTLPIAIIKH